MIETRAPDANNQSSDCVGCRGTKQAPIAAIFSISDRDFRITIALCEECGRDAANAIGFMCIRDGGWSKLEPRKKKAMARFDDAVEKIVKKL